MDPTSFQAITKLEERLQQKKQKTKLKHELGEYHDHEFIEDRQNVLILGAGRPCLVCEEKCVGGLNLHFWRKICINCKCKKEQVLDFMQTLRTLC